MFCILLAMKFSRKEKLHLVVQEAAVPTLPPSLPCFVLVSLLPSE